MCNQPDADTVAILGGRTRTQLMDADTVAILGGPTRTRLRFQQAGCGRGHGCEFRKSDVDADAVAILGGRM